VRPWRRPNFRCTYGSSAAVLAFRSIVVPPFQRRIPSHPQGYWLTDLFNVCSLHAPKRVGAGLAATIAATALKQKCRSPPVQRRCRRAASPPSSRDISSLASSISPRTLPSRIKSPSQLHRPAHQFRSHTSTPPGRRLHQLKRRPQQHPVKRHGSRRGEHRRHRQRRKLQNSGHGLSPVLRPHSSHGAHQSQCIDYRRLMGPPADQDRGRHHTSSTTRRALLRAFAPLRPAATLLRRSGRGIRARPRRQRQRPHRILANYRAVPSPGPFPQASQSHNGHAAPLKR